MVKLTSKNERMPSLSELKEDFEVEVGRSINLYFAPITAVASAVARGVEEANARARRLKSRYWTFAE